MGKKKVKKKLKNKEKKRLRKKANLLFGLFFLFFVVVLLNVLKIEITHEKSGKNMAVISREQLEQSDVLSAERGTIYDAQGNPLAVNVKEYKMIAHLDSKHLKYDNSTYTYVSDYIEDPIEAANVIIDVLGLENDEDAKDLITSQLMQDPDVPGSQVEFGKYGNSITLEQKNQLEESGIKGLEFIEKDDRYYPYGDFASYVIGYARQYVYDELDEEQQQAIFGSTGQSGDVKIVGEMGVEKLLDSWLRGEDGEVEEVKDKQGVYLEEPQIVKQKVDGADVYLTIDSTVQSYVHDFMNEYAKNQKFTNAQTVVLDADTGAVLGAEKMESYDPNLKNIKDYQDPFLDYCYEPGSIIKTFLIVTAMREGVWDASGVYPSGIREDETWGQRNDGSDNYIADWIYNEKLSSWGTINYAQAYYFSSNVGMTYILDDVGYETWIESMKEVFEFGIPVQNHLYESSACTFDPQYKFDIATTTFGQGMTANTMQILRAYTTFSGDGKMVNPYLVDKIVDHNTGEVVYEGIKDKPTNWTVGEGGVEYDEETGQYYKQILTEEQNDEILDLMYGATYYNEGGDFQGTGASYGQTTKYEVGTKTGTAEVAINGSYDNYSNLFSVVIMAPVEDPEIIVYTAVLKPEIQYPQGYMKLYTGAIIDNTLDYLSGETKTEVEYDETVSTLITLKNYKNKTVDEAKAALTEDRLKYKVYGTGTIKYQYPLENSKTDSRSTVYLIGEGATKDDFLGLSQSEMINVCLAYGSTCKYTGSGVVTTITKDAEQTNNYKVTLGEATTEEKTTEEKTTEEKTTEEKTTKEE